MKRRNGYLQLGLAVFLSVSAILLFYDTLFGRRVLPVFGGQLIAAVQPVLIGALLAYLLAPVVNFFDRMLLVPLGGRKPRGRLGGCVRAVSVLLTWLVIGVLVYLLASVLLPELYKSVINLMGNVETYYNTINGWVRQLLDSNPELETLVSDRLKGYYTDITTWLDTLLPQATALMSAVSGGVVSALNFLLDLLVGVIVSIFLLATKEQCAAYARKVIFGLFSESSVPWVLRGIHKVDCIFSGFVRGKLLDSLIIGIICFICCSLFKFPYTPLVSVIVGVTNVIPFFGPFLGAIPSIFLILLDSPIQAAYFALFVLALQQLDGNVIGPLILGDKTGLSSLWVIVAILVGGSFFGVPGMFFGVPVFACFYSAANFFLDVRLRHKDLPLDTGSYTTDFPKTNIKAPPQEKNL